LMDWWVQYYRPPGAVASGAVGVIESFLDVMADVS